ncbi:vWA domain-containing protein [Salinibacillus xinjiangensis]|uniref:VWA domain-containing protein n=1 Tax=Salinibacillus xinjiangensis TaxID=1229268 RepID=A0A6G1X709_9BACI|nr:VWA domain-containing protein [Salinibacillus xinjiangensis]MRG86754.1 VWA domain-containing protein [Salinibacillus xinjiangensis]
MKRLTVVLLFFMLGLSGCSEDEAQKGQEESPTNTEVDTVEHEEAVEDDQGEQSLEIDTFHSIDPSREGMKNQTGGTFLEDISLEQELDMNVEEFMAQNKQELTNDLQRITNENQEPEALAKALAHLLGTPNYTKGIETAEAFQPDFPEPDLPGAKRVNSEEEESASVNGKAILLLDASSSMLLSVEGRVKMDIAKEAVQQFANVIGQENDVSLVVYGHKGSEADSDKQLSCEGIEEVYPMGTYDKKKFEASLNNFESKGWTPLADAIDKAAEMSKGLEGEITLYIVSDGVETCDGNPVASAEDFVKENEHRKVNIIGFNVDEDVEEQLQKVSEAGNGEFYSADDANELKETIEYEWLPSRVDLAWAHTKAPGPWEILAEYDKYDVDHDKIRALVKKEDERYNKVMKILREEEMVPEEVRDELDDLISENYNVRIDELRALRSEKIDEIDAIADEIKKRVNEWKEEMERRKDERGDIW